ncbi:MAG: hypothetical protein KGL39_48470 [Patescibacteria group bacterium]|nr:hypothetical protein [Patescibacteria group bacterium]
MTQLQQQRSFLRRRKLRDERYKRICHKMANWRAAKERKRKERIADGWEPEPKMVLAYRFEFGVRDKKTGETAWHDLVSVRHASKALSLILKYL